MVPSELLKGGEGSRDVQATDHGLTGRLLGPRFRRVLVANDADKAELRHASEHLGSNIGTAGVVAEIFGE
jgi:hypothetical protein